MKLVLLIITLLLFCGCGSIDRSIAGLTGDASETCYDGVTYLQFTSGASVAYETNGSVKVCK